MKSKYLALTFAMVIPTIAHAQSRTPIVVSCKNPDVIGSRVCTALRDEVARNPRYTLANNAPWALSIVSIGPMTGISGQTNMMSAVSISVTLNG